MKQASILLAAFALGVMLSSGTALAVKGPQGVIHTTHNLSANSSNDFQYKAEFEQEVCIFCHTPHGGNLDGPLWNRVTADTVVDLKSVGYFTHYNSTTLSPYLVGLDANRPLNDESLLCMGCHDGTIAANRVVNVSNATTPKDANEPEALIKDSFGGEMIVAEMFFEPAARIGTSREALASWDYSGGHLEDDHPVSIDYDAAQISKGAAALRDIAVVRSRGIRFFPENGAGTRLECSTCHDPHVNYGKYSGRPGYGDAAYTQYAPFLITTNKGSALCLACHIK